MWNFPPRTVFANTIFPCFYTQYIIQTSVPVASLVWFRIPLFIGSFSNNLLSMLYVSKSIDLWKIACISYLFFIFTFLNIYWLDMFYYIIQHIIVQDQDGQNNNKYCVFLISNFKGLRSVYNFLYLFKKLNLWLAAPKGATPVIILLQLTGRWQYDGIMWLALRSVKSNSRLS